MFIRPRPVCNTYIHGVNIFTPSVQPQYNHKITPPLAILDRVQETSILPVTSTEELVQVLQPAMNTENQPNLSLIEKIDSLQNNDAIPMSIQDAFQELSNTLDTDTENAGQSINMVSEQLGRVATDLLAGKQFDVKEVEQLRLSLEDNLSKAPVLNAKIKIALYGVIGALLGFALGLLIGAAVSGGMAAIPGAMLGAFHGFSLVTVAGVGGASIGGAAFSFFCKHQIETSNLAPINREVLAL